jgi:hypothetical protein
MSTKSRETIYGSSIRAAAEPAPDRPVFADLESAARKTSTR